MNEYTFEMVPGLVGRIAELLANIDQKLDPEVVVAKNAITTSHGAMPGKTQTRDVIIYNLDVIISVSYRVKSKRVTQFRIWANSVLKEYLIQGYAVKNGSVQQRYNDLKAPVDVMGRTMGYLGSPASVTKARQRLKAKMQA